MYHNAFFAAYYGAMAVHFLEQLPHSPIPSVVAESARSAAVAAAHFANKLR